MGSCFAFKLPNLLWDFLFLINAAAFKQETFQRLNANAFLTYSLKSNKSKYLVVHVSTEHQAQGKKEVGLDFVWGSLMTHLAS